MGKGRGNPAVDAQQRLSCFRRYLEDKELAENTIVAYVRSMRMFFSRYADVGRDNAISWKAELIESGLRPKSVNVRLNGYNAYCDMLQRGDAKAKTIRVHNATAISNVISVEDYLRLCDVLKSDKKLRYFFTVRLLATTGARVSELIRLRKSDMVRGYAELWTKGKIRRIYIPTSFREEAWAFYEGMPDDAFLVQNRFGAQMTARGVAEVLRRCGEKYNIRRAVMHPHSFRHLFALEFLAKNNNLSLLADIMGHSSVSTTAIYTRMTQEQQVAAVNQIVNW